MIEGFVVTIGAEKGRAPRTPGGPRKESGESRFQPNRTTTTTPSHALVLQETMIMEDGDRNLKFGSHFKNYQTGISGPSSHSLL